MSRLVFSAIEIKDDIYKKMESIYNLCLELKIRIPQEVISFFGNKVPGDRSQQQNVLFERDWLFKFHFRSEHELILDQIPKMLMILRVYEGD